MSEKMTVNDKDYTVIKLLGKGKGGYSYLVTDGESRFVLKQIHHEPCSYYSFGNKLEEYMPEWNFENWGVGYWSKTSEFLKYAEEVKR